MHKFLKLISCFLLLTTFIFAGNEIEDGTVVKGKIDKRKIENLRKGGPVLSSYSEQIKDVLFSDDFESGLGNWAFTPGDWATVTYTSNSPSNSVTESPGVNYSPNDFKPLVINQRFDLAAGSWVSANLSFYHADSTEAGWDFAYVEISTDSSNWTTLGTYDGNSDWTQEIIDLGAYVAEDSVWIRFLFDSDGSVQNEGWYLDDVLLEASLADASPPIVTVTQFGMNHSEGFGDVNIIATITDASALLSQTLYYSFNDVNGTYTSVAMATTGNPDEYSALIPAGVTGDSVFYYVEAEDAFNNIGRDPAAGSVYVYAIFPNAGGPDTYGYTWFDSHSSDPSAPTFSWIDTVGATSAVSSIGAYPIAAGDDVRGTLDLPFNILYYGEIGSQITVTTNGWMGFGPHTNYSSSYWTNVTMPNAAVPNNVMAPLWDDWKAGGTYNGDILWKVVGTAPNRQFVVFWLDVVRFSSDTDYYTFQAIISEGSNNITYQYLDVVGSASAANNGVGGTVGIEDASGTDGLEYTYNANGPLVFDGMAVEFIAPPVAPNGVLTASPDAIDFGRVTLGDTTAVDVDLTNSGSVDITITSIVSDNTDFVVTNVPATVGSISGETFTVSYIPAAGGPSSGSITIDHDGVNGKTLLVIAVSGEAVFYAETFESFTVATNATGYMNGWSADPTATTAAYRWNVNDGPTVSSGTGPNVDHTTGTAAGIFLFTEASSGAAGDTAFVYSAAVDISTLTIPYMSFWYHMVGTGMGEMHVDVSTDAGVNWTLDVMPPLVGSQQSAQDDPWLVANVDLSAFVGQTVELRFRALRGASFSGDMAIDDVSIFDAQLGDIDGTVTAAVSGTLIPDAVVTIGGISDTTDASGNYSITGVLAGTYDVTCTHPVYFDATANGVIISDGLTTTQDFALLWADIAVDPASISVSLNHPNTYATNVTITNAGPGDLTYNSQITLLTERTNTSIYEGNTSASLVADENKEENERTPVYNSTEAVWDLQFSYDVDTPSGLTGIAGAETDGSFLYATKWNGTGEIVKMDLAGNYIETFTIPGVVNIRDMAYDGQYFYGSDASSYIWQMDFTNRVLVSTITTPTSVRAIAYNSDLDGFWYNNFSSSLIFVDRSGTPLDTITTPPSMYGCAYDNLSAGGPYLWFFTGTSTGGGCQVEQFEIAGDSLTGVMHSVSGDLGAYIAGGLFLQPNLVSGTYTLGGLAQGTPDLIFGYELGAATPPWLYFTGNSSGVVPAGSSVDVGIMLDATGLANEIKTANIVVSNNSLTTPDVTVPVQMFVGAPDSSVIFADDFEAYTAGVQLTVQNSVDWTPWSGTPGVNDPYISTTYAHSGVNSVNIITDDDLVKAMPNYTAGAYKMSFDLYVPTGTVAYFNTLQEFAPTPTWGMQVYFRLGGVGEMDADGALSAAFTYAYDTWLHNEVFVNLDKDTAEYYIDGARIHGWKWSEGAFSGNNLNQLGGNNFYGGGPVGTFDFYVDDYELKEISPALFADDFDSYVAGAQLTLQNSADWRTWSGGSGTSEDPYVSNAYANSGMNSTVIVYNNDVVKLLGSKTSGVYSMSWQMYIPNGGAGYFNTMGGFAPNPNNWAMSVDFNVGGGANLNDIPGSPYAFTYAYDTWHQVEVVVDLDQDLAEFRFNGAVIHQWQWTQGTKPLRLDANDFWGQTVDDEMYIDDYVFDTTDPIVSSIDDETNSIPLTFDLNQNYPNPFNPTTTIRYQLPKKADVKIVIYNMLGQLVRTVVDKAVDAGYQEVVWDGLNDTGNRVATGVYIYRMEADKFVKAHKMIMMK